VLSSKVGEREWETSSDLFASFVQTAGFESELPTNHPAWTGIHAD
jgi:hypothetical protein